MTFKLGRIFYFILIICTFLWNQQALLLNQKISVENSYRDKVVSAVSRLLGQNNFIVIVNVEFSSSSGSLKKTAESQTRQGTSKGYTPIPGLLPTVPSRDGSLSNNRIGEGRFGENNYSISRIEVDINLNKDLATADIKQEIRSLIQKTIPEIRECNDCIKIETLGFLPLEKSKEIQELKRELEELKSEQRQAEEAVLIKELQDAENRLNELQNEKQKSDEKIKSRDEELERRDALAHSRLVEFEKNRNKQDSIRNVNTENELRQVRDSKIRSDSTLLSKTMGIVEKQVGDNGNNKGLLGMQLGSGGSSIMGSVIFILLIICLMIVTFLAASNKKPKPIYLKPKTKSNKGVESANNEKEEVNVSATESISPTMRRDEEAARSELRSLRQTAVSLSVGEKESASALIKEWLEDNPNKVESQVEE